VRIGEVEMLAVQHIRDLQTGQAFLAAWTKGPHDVSQCQIVPYCEMFTVSRPTPHAMPHPEPRIEDWL
jgi:hypothetical protein